MACLGCLEYETPNPFKSCAMGDKKSLQVCRFSAIRLIDEKKTYLGNVFRCTFCRGLSTHDKITLCPEIVKNVGCKKCMVDKRDNNGKMISCWHFCYQNIFPDTTRCSFNEKAECTGCKKKIPLYYKKKLEEQKLAIICKNTKPFANGLEYSKFSIEQSVKKEDKCIDVCSSDEELVADNNLRKDDDSSTSSSSSSSSTTSSSSSSSSSSSTTTSSSSSSSYSSTSTSSLSKTSNLISKTSNSNDDNEKNPEKVMSQDSEDALNQEKQRTLEIKNAITGMENHGTDFEKTHTKINQEQTTIEAMSDDLHIESMLTYPEPLSDMEYTDEENIDDLITFHQKETTKKHKSRSKTQVNESPKTHSSNISDYAEASMPLLQASDSVDRNHSRNSQDRHSRSNRSSSRAEKRIRSNQDNEFCPTSESNRPSPRAEKRIRSNQDNEFCRTSESNRSSRQADYENSLPSTTIENPSKLDQR